MITTKAIDCLENEYAISPYARYLKKHGFIAPAIYYKNMNETKERRSARALRHIYETAPMPEYREGQIMAIDYTYQMRKIIKNNPVCSMDINGMCVANRDKFSKLPADNRQEEEIREIIILNSEAENTVMTDMRYYVKGMHHVIDFRFLLKNGINGYKKIIAENLAKNPDASKTEFYEGLLDTIIGLETFIGRYVEHLKAIPNPDEKLTRLIKTLEVVPMNPATNFYEAIILMHSTMHLSDCLEPGRLDNLLYPYFVQDETADLDFAYECIRALFEDIEHRMSHPLTMHVTIGGTKPDGSQDYNDLTTVCVKAIGGLRAPNVSLRVCENMPEELWDAFLYNISQGYAQPAILNEKMYIDGLINQYNVPPEDAVDYVFGGCSELLIQGKTFVDAHWMAYNVLDVLEQTIFNKFLECDTYEEFYKCFEYDIDLTVKNACEQMDIRQHAFGENNTYPLRSLFTYPCVEKGEPFTKGGALYNYDFANIYGSTNAINALYSLKQYYDGKLNIGSKLDILKALAHNYVGYEDIYQQFKDVPKYGNFNSEIDEITTAVMSRVMDQMKSHRCYRGNGYFMPGLVLFTHWTRFGRRVGATPDGRRSSDILADSAAPYHGTDKEGPTSTMGAALAIPQGDCIGTCVLNLRLDSKNFKDDMSKEKVRQLCEHYITGGGCQLQINVLDRETLLDALENPEEHEDIIVRVGGFSDNFIFLADPIKKQVIERTEL